MQATTPQQELEQELDKQAEAIAPTCQSCLYFDQPTDKYCGFCCWHFNRVFGRDKACSRYEFDRIGN